MMWQVLLVLPCCYLGFLKKMLPTSSELMRLVHIVLFSAVASFEDQVDLALLHLGRLEIHE
jgi:hypothetical protein